MIGIYVRVSTAEQVTKYSLTAQKDRGVEFALQKGESHRVYEDAGLSGSNTSSRPQLQSLLQDIQSGVIKSVWVIEFTRLSRNLDDLQLIRKLFIEHSVSLYVDGHLTSLESPDDSFMFNVRASISQYEREKTIERMKRGIASQQDSGRRHATSIYGYKRVFDEDGTVHWVVDDTEAHVVRMIFQKYLQLQSIRAVRVWLNSEGIRTKKGRLEWYQSTVGQILSNVQYIGKSRNSSGEIIDSSLYEPIIDEDTWSGVQELKKSRWSIVGNTGVRKKGVKPGLHRSTGIVRCRECGLKYHFQTVRTGHGRGNGKLYEYHRYKVSHRDGCSNTRNSFHEWDLDLILLFSTLDYLENWKAVHDVYKSEVEERLSLDEAQASVDRLKASLQEVKKKKEKLVDAVEKGVFTAEDIQVNMESLRSDEGRLNTSLREHHERMKSAHEELQLTLSKLSYDSRAHLSDAFGDNAKEYNRLLKTYIRDATIMADDLHIHFLTSSTRVDLSNLPSSLQLRIAGYKTLQEEENTYGS